MVYILLANGVEETEAVAPCDILRRGGVEVAFAGVGGTEITGGHGIRLTADCRVEDVDPDDVEMIIVPGGLGGVENIEASEDAMALVLQSYQLGAYAAAICAGPRVLAKLGILRGRRAVCYPGMEDQMEQGRMQGGLAAKDGRVITGQAPGAALDFGFALLSVLKNSRTAVQVSRDMCWAIREMGPGH